MHPQYDAIVIGAGLNGLAASAALGRAGKRVVLVERGPTPGGEARAMQFAEGFRAAPLALDPGWIPPMVAKGLGLRLEGQLVPSETTTAVRTGPGWLSLAAEPSRAADAIRQHSPRDAERWPGFALRLKRIAGVLETLYQMPAPDIDTTSIRELVSLLGVGRKVRGLGREDMTEFLRIMPMAIQELVDDTFECEPLKAAIAAAGVQDIRQGPRSGGTSFVMLHHLVGAVPGSIRGRPAWKTGPNGLAGVFEHAARGAGVNIRTGVEVQRIMVQDDRVAGIVLSGDEEITAPVVISTLDPVQTLLRLVDPVWLEPDFLNAVQNIKLRGCRATALFALDELPDPSFGDGVVSLTPDTVSLERACDAAKYGEVSETPHITFTVPTLRWPDLAPPGKHVMVAHVQYVPYGAAGGGSREAGENTQASGNGQEELDFERPVRPTGSDLADRVTRMIDEAIPGFAARVLHRVCHTPADLEQRFGITQGAVTHGELTLDQILFMRPVPGWGRHATPISGLYLGGAGTHPGPGILGGPGWLAARRALPQT